MKFEKFSFYLEREDKFLLALGLGLTLILAIATYIHAPSSEKTYYKANIVSVIAVHGYGSIGETAVVILENGDKVTATNSTDKILKSGEVVTVVEYHNMNTNGSSFRIK